MKRWIGSLVLCLALPLVADAPIPPPENLRATIVAGYVSPSAVLLEWNSPDRWGAGVRDVLYEVLRYDAPARGKFKREQVPARAYVAGGIQGRFLDDTVQAGHAYVYFVAVANPRARYASVEVTIP
jgi:hypothetical protein